MSNVIALGQKGRIDGAWKHCDGFSEVEFLFSVAEGELTVSVVDGSDGERPEIYDVNWIESQLELRFAVLWSSGRLTKYRASVGPNKDRLLVTATSTWQEMWERL